jgi:hypothetical protein
MMPMLLEGAGDAALKVLTMLQTPRMVLQAEQPVDYNRLSEMLMSDDV